MKIMKNKLTYIPVIVALFLSAGTLHGDALDSESDAYNAAKNLNSLEAQMNNLGLELRDKYNTEYLNRLVNTALETPSNSDIATAKAELKTLITKSYEAWVAALKTSPTGQLILAGPEVAPYVLSNLKTKIQQGDKELNIWDAELLRRALAWKSASLGN